MWPLPALIVITAGIVLLLSGWRTWARHRAHGARAAELWSVWAGLSTAQRVPEFGRLLRELDEAPDADRPGAERARAQVAFFLGCAHLGRRDPAGADRMFQVAYHADPGLRMALVLAFACLKVDARRIEELAVRCRDTWRELGSPRLGGSRRERLLLRPGRARGIDALPDRLPGWPTDRDAPVP